MDYEFYKEIALGEGNKDVLVSPYSVMAASLLLQTVEEEDEKLEVGSSQEDWPQEFKKNVDGLKGESMDSTSMVMANCMFARQGLAVNPAYSKQLSKFFGGEFEPILHSDFLHDPDGSNIRINRWVEQQTRDQIHDILPDGSISADTFMIIVSASYFKGRWLEAFDEGRTVDAIFHRTEESTKQVKMMCDTREVRFIKDEKYTAVELLYDNSDLSMVFFRPEEIEGLKHFECSLDDCEFNYILRHIISMSTKTKVNLRIPEFKMEAAYTLKKTFETKGDVFKPWNGNFTKMLPDSPEAFVSEWFHKTCIEVTSERTEDTATAAERKFRLRHEKETETENFFLDRPFMFVVYENKNGIDMIVGRCTDPKLY